MKNALNHSGWGDHPSPLDSVEPCYAGAMSVGFHTYADIGLLFIRGQGVITQGERIRAMLAWLNDPQYGACRDAIFDVTAAESTPKVGELRELIAILKRHLPPRGPQRLAIVTSKPIAYGVARVFEQLMRLFNVPLHVRVFLDPNRAWTWLRPDGPPFEPR
jgi:hypothetical protein